MADYFTRFSCLLDVGTPDKAARAYEAFTALRNDSYAETEDLHCGFDLSIQNDPSGSTLGIHDDGNGDVEAVIQFVLRLAEELDLTGLRGFSFALTCSGRALRPSAVVRMCSTLARGNPSAGPAARTG